jgi:acyl carrier protein
MEDFESSMAEILEVDHIELTDELESFDTWDSLTILSIIAFCEEKYNVALSAIELEDSKTICGLKELIKSKI